MTLTFELTSASSLDAEKLADRLGGLPLALATTGEYTRRNKISFKEYLDYYETEWNALKARDKELSDYEGRTLYTTWNISLAKIQIASPDAAALLRFFAYFDKNAIWYDLVAQTHTEQDPRFGRALNSTVEFKAAMSSLQELSLVEHHASTDAFSLHKCVQDWTLYCLNEEPDVDLYWMALLCVSLRSDDHDRSVQSSLVQHAERLMLPRFELMLRGSHPYACLDTISRVAGILRTGQRNAKAVRMYMQALDSEKIDEEKSESDHLDTFRVRLFQADAIEGRGFLEDAVEETYQILQDAAGKYGEPHVIPKICMYRLAGMHYYLSKHDQERLAQAEILLRRLLNIIEKGAQVKKQHLEFLRGLERVSIEQLKYELSSVCTRQERYEEAENMIQEILEDHRKTYREKESSNWCFMQLLGKVRLVQGRLDESEALMKISANNVVRDHGLDHKDRMHMILALATVQVRQGRLAEAKETLTRTGQSLLPGMFPYVIDCESRELVKDLLDEGIPVDSMTSRGETALLLTLKLSPGVQVEDAHMQILRLLLDRGADVNCTDYDGFFPLGQAAQRGFVTVVDLLLEHGADVSINDPCSAPALVEASRSGHQNVVKTLLDRGALIDAQNGHGWTALTIAAAQGHENTVNLLLDRGASIDAQDGPGWTAVAATAVRGRIKTLELLHARGADVNIPTIHGDTPLILAISNDYIEVAELLLSIESMDINAANENGATALHSAAARGNIRIVDLLLAHQNIHVLCTDDFGQTPLQVATEEGHSEVVELLRRKTPKRREGRKRKTRRRIRS